MADTIELDTMDSGAYDRRSERATLARDNLSLTSDLKQLSSWRQALQIGVQWAVIVAAVTLAEVSDSTLVCLIAVIIIATRQHALLVLMHDAAHLLISRDKRRNDLISNVFLTFPLTLSTSRYRAHHIAHHKHLNTPDDPDYADAFAPASSGLFWQALLRDISGLSTLQSLRTMDSFSVIGLFTHPVPSTRIERYQAMAFYACAALLITALQAWPAVLLYWLAPLVFFLPPILRIRSLSEHAGLSTQSVKRDARSVSPGWLERGLFAPCNINRHWEHHLFQQIPSYHLGTLSRRLAQSLPGSAAACSTQGYLLGERSMRAELYGANGRARAVASLDQEA
ncbi:fatty acid desaturase family protein [Pseudomonas syringae]|uniref:Fatty acid desaturase n=1 Tax=Pseudomonas syringae pv. syringae (strain B728a) TaxID=205918 RepID=Q4ZTC9_PSEU2|nr:fatty acid desaturase family protein [Pseudomonas syringae]AAY37593.1 Fatty acid desaturase [Pseudomonas syringae pv. syringae B728a]PYD19123.1 fatty acid desaturase [Pseudomonas syringae pv. syringae]